MKDKIKQLLALAADPGAAPQEAETAARQAAKLMAKYDISLADLEEDALRVEFDLTSMDAPGSRPGKKNAKVVPPWIGIIAWGVKLYTRTRVVNGAGGVIRFSGPREDVELAVWLHTLLVEGAYKASQGQDHPNAFRNGYAGVIQQRLKALLKARSTEEQENPQAGALVIFQGKREQIMDQAYGPDMRGKKSSVTQNQAGRAAGAAAHIPTNRPVTGPSRSLLK